MYKDYDVTRYTGAVYSEIHRLARRCGYKEEVSRIYNIDVAISEKVIMVTGKYKGYFFTGYAICNRVDTFNIFIGLSIATARMLRNIVASKLDKIYS